MIPFMNNVCMHGNCKCTDCYTCQFYKPRFFGVPVTRKLSKILYNLECKMMQKEYTKLNSLERGRSNE